MTFYYWRIFPDKAIVNGEIYVLTVKSCRYTFFRFGGTICMICVKKSSVYGVFWSPPFFSFKYTVWCQIIYFYRLRDVPENIISTEMTSFPLCLTTDDIFHFMFFPNPTFCNSFFNFQLKMSNISSPVRVCPNYPPCSLY